MFAGTKISMARWGKGEILQQSIVVSILDLNTTDTRPINTPAFILGSSNFKLPANPKSASEIWNQWHGIEIHSDIPVERVVY